MFPTFKFLSKYFKLCINAVLDMSNSSQSRNQVNAQGSVQSIVCRICYDADSQEALITPCRCKGTVAYVHRTCLETWLAEANATNCELCHQVFHTERTPKYTTCQSIWRWFKYQPTANEVGRGIFGDILACTAITPMAIIITYVCLFSSDYYNQRKFQAMTAAKWTSVSLLVMIGIMLVGYYMWVFSIIKLHMNVWYNWWQRECIVRYIPPTTVSIPMEPRITRRESSIISLPPLTATRHTEDMEIIDIETVEPKIKFTKPIFLPRPHKNLLFFKSQTLYPIEERNSETIINIVQSSSKTFEMQVTTSSKIIVENEEEQKEELRDGKIDKENEKRDDEDTL